MRLVAFYLGQGLRNIVYAVAPEVDHTETVTPENPLGAKGIGEARTIGSTPAIVNAVIDALGTFGIHSLDMPLTPGKIWTAIESAR